MVRDIKQRAVVFLEEILEVGGYFAAVEEGFFVDSAKYPERNGDGIARDGQGGVAADTIVPRDPDYLAPVCDHFGDNAPAGGIGPGLRPDRRLHAVRPVEDRLHRRAGPARTASSAGWPRPLPYRTGELIRPEAEWAGDGVGPAAADDPRRRGPSPAAAALEMARRMGLADPEVVNLDGPAPRRGMLRRGQGHGDHRHPARRPDDPTEGVVLLSEDELRAAVRAIGLTVVAGTVGEDEHSVGMREILDIKHGGIEKYGVKYHYLGTSVPLGKLVDAASRPGRTPS